MPVKAPIIKKSHILAIIIVSLLAGLIGASPEIYKRLSAEIRVTNLLQDVVAIDAGDKAKGEYSYAFPVVLIPDKQFFPFIPQGYEVYVQDGSPAYISSFTHPEYGCNWAGVAGQVFGPDNKPVSGFTVVISGSIDGSYINQSGVTGSAQAYGPGGYEVKISSAPFTSDGSLTAYLLDTELKQVAAPVPVTTYQDCQSNLLLLNYVKVK